MELEAQLAALGEEAAERSRVSAMADLERLRATLGTSELCWILERARRRLESGLELTGRVTLAEPTEAQRRALDRLLGRPSSRGAALSVELERLDEILRHAGICAGLEEALETLAGPIVDRRARRVQLNAELNAAWERIFAEASARGDCDALRRWLDELRRSGLVKRLASGSVETARPDGTVESGRGVQ